MADYKERNDQIAAEYNSGSSLAEIALRFGMTKQNVHKILKAREDVVIRQANGWTEKTRRLRRGRP